MGQPMMTDLDTSVESSTLFYCANKHQLMDLVKQRYSTDGIVTGRRICTFFKFPSSCSLYSRSVDGAGFCQPQIPFLL